MHVLYMSVYCLFDIVPSLDLLGKRVQRSRSLPNVTLRSFLNGTQVSQNTAGDEMKFLMSKNYSGKICYVQIILNNIFTNYNLKDLKNVEYLNH